MIWFLLLVVIDILFSPEIDEIRCPYFDGFSVQSNFEKRENHENSPSITRLTMWSSTILNPF
jgi:hypothetical protein